MQEESISKAMQLQMISVVIHSCSSIARNPNRYQAFHRATKGHFKYAELKSFMRDCHHELLQSKFAQIRPASLTLKTLEVYATCAVLDGDATRFFIDFMFNHYPRFVTELSKFDGTFPDRAFFEARTTVIDETVENACVFQMMLSRHIDEHPEYTYQVAVSKDIEYLFEYAEQILSASSLAKSPKSNRRVTSVEKFFRDTLLSKKHGNHLRDYFTASTMTTLSSFAQEFCNNDVMSYKFTEKDGMAMARCIYQIIQTQMIYKSMPKSGKTPSAKEITDIGRTDSYHFKTQEYEDVFEDFDLNHFRILYAFGKMAQNDTEELFQMFLGAMPDDDDASSVSNGDVRRLRQQLDEKNQLISKQQELLNNVQIDLDRKGKETRELQEELQDASANLQEMQNLLEKVSNQQTQIDDIESEESYDFPERTILFGGHPNWQSKFKLLYPDVKVYESTDLNFPLDVIRNANLVLLNVTHMPHKQYYRIIQEVRKHHIRIEYIK